jgi:protein tyrosine/serine phosphatase
MLSSKRTTLTAISVLTLIFTCSAISFGQKHLNNFPNVKIKNFGQMDERFYRGAQPKEEDFKDLLSIGIKTVVDLRDNPESYEKQDVEALGMRYVNIPMSDSEYPKAEQVDRFLKLIEEPMTGKFYVHCAGGRHRTGVIGAVYRFNHYHWNYDQVYAEMKSYDFYTRWGHGAMKDFVQDYWRHIQQGNQTALTTEVKSAVKSEETLN